MLASIEAAYLARADGEADAQRSQERMRSFIADASHELRTPLASVRGLAEYGLQQNDAASREELLRLMTLIARESGRMGRLIDDLLLLARFDAGRPLDRRPVDLASIAAEAVQHARMVATDGRYAGGRRSGDRGRRRRAAAADHRQPDQQRHPSHPAGTPVMVTVTSDPGSGRLTVADRGPGMTPEQASRVFERFYRTNSARTRASGGTGLGLAIAASLAAAHGGELTVDTKPGRGAAFHLRLPQAEAFQVTATESQTKNP